LNEGLAEIDGVRIQRTPVGYKHIYHLYVLFHQPVKEGSNIEKEDLIRILDQEDGIEIIIRYFPIHLLPEIRCQGHDFGECPVAEKIRFEQHINLPIYPSMTIEQVDYMIDRICRAVKKVRA
jgi:perosamine synthetase